MRNDEENKYRNICYCIYWMYLVCTFSNQQTLKVRVNKVDKIEEVSGSKESISTQIYYLLYTDRGTFRINIDGILAHPELAGKLEKDSIYEISVCGVDVPFCGVYRNVVDVK